MSSYVVVTTLDKMFVLNATDVEAEGENVYLLNGFQKIAWFPREAVSYIYVQSRKHV